MQNWRPISIVVVALAGCLSSSAEIIPEALLSFPSQTSYVEYDNLQSLRTLKNYSVLRQRFTGKPLEEAKAALARLDIQEDQVHEIVSGTSPTAFYGLVSGIFSGQAAAAVGKRKGFAVKILESQAYCPGGQSCVVFLENSLAAFGTPAELKRMLEARQGFTTRLSSNRDVVSLLSNTEWQAPVRGAMFGGELNIAIAGLLKDWTGWNRDWSALAANMKALGYSVRFDSQAHVSATLECTTKAAASLLVQMLGALGSFQSVSTPSAGAKANAPFQNLQVSSSGNTVAFKVDTPLPTAVPGVR